MIHLEHTKIKALLAMEPKEQEVIVKGWVRTHRGSKKVSFVALNDGSTIHNIQLVVNPDDFDETLLKKITTGACLRANGTLVASAGSGQPVEIQVKEIELYGEADPQTYPLQKKGHSMEFLREIAHLRPRTNTFGAVLRIRHAMSYAIHNYFQNRGFYYLHTPFITGSDAEGAGEMFRVSILDPKNPPLTETGEVDFSQDFFAREAHLTVSGQLEGELGALALSEVYTFGPTFRAENSNTPRHLAEFWMIEPEMAFYEIKENMDLAEDFLKSLVKYALDHCESDLAFFQKMYDPQLMERLQFVLENDFIRSTYTEAVDILLKANQKWEFPIEWGKDLQAEHERFLVEKHFKCPVMLTDYPKKIKAFYMYLNDDNNTIRGLDVLFPLIGEIIGGSQREHRLDVLTRRMKEMNMPEKEMWWYLDSRRFGTAPHSGFGLGFERLIMFITGLSNIRDVIPFPRTPRNVEF